MIKKIVLWTLAAVGFLVLMFFVMIYVKRDQLISGLEEKKMKLYQKHPVIKLTNAYAYTRNSIQGDTYSFEQVQKAILTAESKLFNKETYKYTLSLYDVNNPNTHNCEDCIVTKNSFKIMAYENLDDDETLDVWTYDEKKELIHLINDIEE